MTSANINLRLNNRLESINEKLKSTIGLKLILMEFDGRVCEYYSAFKVVRDLYYANLILKKKDRTERICQIITYNIWII